MGWLRGFVRLLWALPGLYCFGFCVVAFGFAGVLGSVAIYLFLVWAWCLCFWCGSFGFEVGFPGFVSGLVCVLVVVCLGLVLVIVWI